MSHNSMLINYNAISNTLRNKTLLVHYDRLRQIKIRKNFYLERNPSLQFKKKPTQKPINSSFIQQKNLLLKNRLNNIFHRENHSLFDLSKSNDLIKQRHSQKQKTNEIIIRKINDDNNLLKNRVKKIRSEVKIKQFEKDFKESRNFVKHMLKIKKQNQSSCDVRFHNLSVVKFPVIK